MWHTNTGDRVLEGAEAVVFAQSLWDLGSNIQVFEGDYDVGLHVFDRLTYGQKIYLLSVIAGGLLKADEPVRELTAAVECAIAAVFEHLKGMVAVEIDMQEIETNWRELVLAALHQVEDDDLLDLNNEEHEDWNTVIDGLSYFILWDADYENEDIFLDDVPEDNAVFKDLMRISDDYFMEIPEDLKPEEIEVAMAKIRRVCQSVCG